jgi:hypothetical protein
MARQMSPLTPVCIDAARPDSWRTKPQKHETRLEGGPLSGEPGNISDLAVAIFPGAGDPAVVADRLWASGPLKPDQPLALCGDDRLRTFPTIPGTSLKASVQFTRGRTRVTFGRRAVKSPVRRAVKFRIGSARELAGR